MHDPESENGILTLYASTTQPQSPSHSPHFKIQIPEIPHVFAGAGDLFGALLLALLLERPTQLDWVCEQATSRLHSILQSTYAKKSVNGSTELDLIQSQNFLTESPIHFSALPCESISNHR